MKGRMHVFMIAAVSILFSIFLAGTSFGAGEAGTGGMGYEKGAMNGKAGTSDSYFRASKWMDKTVKSTSGKEIGEVKDIVFGYHGRPEYVILSHEDKLVPVPFRAGDFRMEGDNLVANLDKSKLDGAPSFTEDNWPNFASNSFDQKINTYYGVGHEKGGQGMKTSPGERGMKGAPGDSKGMESNTGTGSTK